MRIQHCLVLFFCLTIIISGCRSPVYDQTVANVAAVKIKAQNARAKSVGDARNHPPLVVRDGPYVDLTPIDLSRSPSWLNNHIVIRGDQLPFSYYSRTIAAGAGREILPRYQNELDQGVIVSMSYSGTVRGALELLSAKTGYLYRIRGCTIQWDAMVSKTFDIAFIPGASDYLVGNTSGTSGTTNVSSSTTGMVANYVSSDYSAAEYSSLSAKLSVWDDLEKTLSTLKSPLGQISVSQATTTVTVRDRPPIVNLMGQYIANLNRKMSRQVLVKVQILEVSLENDYTFGINWNAIAKALTNTDFVLNANYGSPVSIQPFTSQTGSAFGNTGALPALGLAPELDPTTGLPKVPSYGVLFQALNQQGKTSIVSEPQAVCLNNQVSVIRNVNSQNYVASIQNTAIAGTSTGAGTNNVGTVTSQVTPGTVTTGVTIYLLPKIMGNRVYLNVNADISTLNSLNQIGVPGVQLQNPDVTTQHFNQRSLIRSGDTMILAGYRQLNNTARAQQLFRFQSLGGKGSQMLNIETIILITPYVLPGSV